MRKQRKIKQPITDPTKLSTEGENQRPNAQPRSQPPIPDPSPSQRDEPGNRSTIAGKRIAGKQTFPRSAQTCR